MKGNKKDFKFDAMASSYDEGFGGKLSKRFYELLLRQISVHDGAAVLDVGCGTGTILKSLSARANIDGYGIDAEENMITEAQRKCPDMNILVADCANTPFANDQFDAIVSCMAYHHFGDQTGFAKEAARILKPGGYLYITDPRFPWIIRKPLNFAIRAHKVAGYFATPREVEATFSEYGFELVDCAYDLYAQCVKLIKSP